MNANHDLIDPAYIPWPKRASVEQYDIMLIDKGDRPTQNKDKNQNKK